MSRFIPSRVMAYDELADAGWFNSSRYPDADFMGGFNARVQGDDWIDVPPWGRSGWLCAHHLIERGKIYAVHQFPHDGCDGHAFIYGGFWVCNKCGGKGLDKPWWRVRVEQDGNAWCCTGEGFVNLQESRNFAFGATCNEALAEYKKTISEVTL